MGRSWLGASLPILLVVATAACGGEPPVRHPVTMIQDRMRPRIALVEFIVKDEARRERVTELLVQIEELTFDWQRSRLERRRQLLGADGSSGTLTEETLEADFAQARAATGVFYRQYVDLQMALREATTAEEFARLDEVK